jgi:hypothetical protein
MTYFDADGCGYETPGDAKAAPEHAAYPEDWTAEERLAAYWYAHRRSITVRNTNEWSGVRTRLEDDAERHKNHVNQILNEPLF